METKGSVEGVEANSGGEAAGDGMRCDEKTARRARKESEGGKRQTMS